MLLRVDIILTASSCSRSFDLTSFFKSSAPRHSGAELLKKLVLNEENELRSCRYAERKSLMSTFLENSHLSDLHFRRRDDRAQSQRLFYFYTFYPKAYPTARSARVVAKSSAVDRVSTTRRSRPCSPQSGCRGAGACADDVRVLAPCTGCRYATSRCGGSHSGTATRPWRWRNNHRPRTPTIFA